MHLLAVDADPVGTSEIEQGDGGVGDVQLRMFAGQLGVRNDDLGAAASDPEPSPPQGNDQAGARPAVHGKYKRVPHPGWPAGTAPSTRTAPSDEGALADGEGSHRDPVHRQLPGPVAPGDRRLEFRAGARGRQSRWPAPGVPSASADPGAGTRVQCSIIG